MSILLSFLFFFFLPGYVITLAMPWVHGLPQRLAVSVVTSVALGVILSTILAIAGMPVGLPLFILLIAITCAGFFFPRKKLLAIVHEWKESVRGERILVLSVLVLSVLAAVFIAEPHFNYSWPIHADEWWAVSATQNLIEGRPLNMHPYFLSGSFPDYKPGFTSYLAGVLGFMGYDPVDAWSFLPALNIFFVSFIVALLLFRYARDSIVGISFPFLLVALRSNAYMLGWWFFIPSTFAFIFILPLFISVSDWMRSARGMVWASGIFVALSLVYFPLAIFAAVALLPAVIMKEKKYRLAFWAGLAGIAAFVITVGIALSPYKVYWSFASAPAIPAFFSDFIHAFFVPISATTHFFRSENLFSIAGIPLLLLAAIAVRQLVLKSGAWIRTVGLGAALGFFNLVLVWSLGISFAVFHQRAFQFTGVMIAVLAALGAASVFRWLFSLPFVKRSKNFKYPIMAIVAGALVFSLFFGYFNLPSGANLYYILNQEDLVAMRWLKGQPALRSIAVLTDATLGTVITPLTRLPSKISLASSQNIESVINPAQFGFTSKSCGEKEKLIISMGAGIIYSREAQICGFFREIYRSDLVFIYLYTKAD